MSNLTPGRANIDFSLKITMLSQVSRFQGKIGQQPITKNGTNGCKTKLFGFAAISTIYGTPFWRKKIVEKHSLNNFYFTYSPFLCPMLPNYTVYGMVQVKNPRSKLGHSRGIPVFMKNIRIFWEFQNCTLRYYRNRYRNSQKLALWYYFIFNSVNQPLQITVVRLKQYAFNHSHSFLHSFIHAVSSPPWL